MVSTVATYAVNGSAKRRPLLLQPLGEGLRSQNVQIAKY